MVVEFYILFILQLDKMVVGYHGLIGWWHLDGIFALTILFNPMFVGILKLRVGEMGLAIPKL